MAVYVIHILASDVVGMARAVAGINPRTGTGTWSKTSDYNPSLLANNQLRMVSSSA